MSIRSVPVAALAYFGMAFGAGFVLGTVRVLWLVPLLGIRAAELLEMPVMLVVVTWAARAIIARGRIESRSRRLLVGALALSFLLLAEWGVLRFVRGQDLEESLAERDPVSGSVYLLLLVYFGLGPWLVGRRARS